MSLSYFVSAEELTGDDTIVYGDRRYALLEAPDVDDNGDVFLYANQVGSSLNSSIILHAGDQILVEDYDG